MSFCKQLPACRRASCGQEACVHEPEGNHQIVGLCEGYVYPEGWGICMRCGFSSTDHDNNNPHTRANEQGVITCIGFTYTPGLTEAMFVGGGGSFGGGGATGRWFVRSSSVLAVALLASVITTACWGNPDVSSPDGLPFPVPTPPPASVGR